MASCVRHLPVRCSRAPSTFNPRPAARLPPPRPVCSLPWDPSRKIIWESSRRPCSKSHPPLHTSFDSLTTRPTALPPLPDLTYSPGLPTMLPPPLPLPVACLQGAALQFCLNPPCAQLNNVTVLDSRSTCSGRRRPSMPAQRSSSSVKHRLRALRVADPGTHWGGPCILGGFQAPTHPHRKHLPAVARPRAAKAVLRRPVEHLGYNHRCSRLRKHLGS